MEPIITTTALASFLSLLFTEGGKTLATESVKLALQNRQDIKDGFVNLFKHDEIITLGLNEEKSPEQVKELLEANPEIAQEIDQRVKDNSELLDQLAKILSKHEGRTINTKYYIENVEQGHFS